MIKSISREKAQNTQEFKLLKLTDPDISGLLTYLFKL